MQSCAPSSEGMTARRGRAKVGTGASRAAPASSDPDRARTHLSELQHNTGRKHTGSDPAHSLGNMTFPMAGDGCSYGALAEFI
jgi:hypothetical protein